MVTTLLETFGNIDSDKLTGIYNEIFGELDVTIDVRFVSDANIYELLLTDGKRTVGLPVPVAETLDGDVESQLRNVFVNLRDLYLKAVK